MEPPVPVPADHAWAQQLDLVEAVARRLPEVPRLAILDAVESEWHRLGADLQPALAPLVAPAAVWRLLHLGRDPLAA
ncbi:hypothetical protein [Amnibacterium endophyticum]|uniref:Uncharacterized protein n=1 Tax=Amnibacterium endophyticum TaxID=2109337 RepID=A0ABW4LDL8_9MICO